MKNSLINKLNNQLKNKNMAEFQTTTISPSMSPFVINGSSQRFVTPTIVPSLGRYAAPFRQPKPNELILACGASGTAQVKDPVTGIIKDVAVTCTCGKGQTGCSY